MSDVLRKDGSVVQSSQRQYEEHAAVGQFQFPKIGIILTVQPSDADGNMVGAFNPNRRGNRHECTVLAVSDLGIPDDLIHNVVVPPQRPSGIDNFEDDLPRGCSTLIDGTSYNTDFSDVDFGLLDGEWCVVNFIGGRKENAYISNWWPHPINDIDPATSGASTEDGPSNLVQADIKKNRMRRFLRKNGVEFLLNRQGSLMLDTNEAGRSVTIDDNGKRSVSKVDKGGHLQVDVKQKAQMEFNWNEKVKKGPRQGPGGSASSPYFETDIPCDDQPFSETTPKARETKRTWMRFKEYQAVVKSSDIQITAKTEGNEDGQLTLFGTKNVALVQQDSGSQAARVQLNGGSVIIQAKDGTTATISSDQIALVTKSGAQVSVIGDKVMLTAPGGAAVSVPVAFGTGVFGAMMGQPFSTASGSLNTTWSAFLNALKAYVDGIKAVAELPGAPVYPLTEAVKAAITALTQAITAFNATSATWTSQQVKLQ